MENDPRTRGRICKWYDMNDELVQLTVDTWDKAGELDTVVVINLGPFDDPEKVERYLLSLLTQQQVLF